MKFRQPYNKFKSKLKSDILKIKASKNVLVFAHKTSNIYELSPQDPEKMLKESITKIYKKAPQKLEQSIDLEAKHIDNEFDISDRIECLANQQAFITLKDHKEYFNSNPKCRLLNPTKSELGKVSKFILEKINKNLKDILILNQWKNTNDVLEWFNNISDKRNCAFIQLDIAEFYPSITEKILKNALSFAKQHTEINKNETRTINHCRKSLLFHQNEAWKKKSSYSCFDVTINRSVHLIITKLKDKQKRYWLIS